MLPVLQIGGAALPLPPLILLLGLYIALDVAQRQAVKRRVNGDHIYNIGFNSLVIGLLAGRLAFVLLNLDAYLQIRPVGRMLLSFITPLLGSEVPLVGVLAALGVMVYFMRKHKIDWLRAADAYATGAAVFVVALWLAHLSSGDAYGVATRLPWGVNLWAETRHPTQVYNLLVSGGILYVLLRLEPAQAAAKQHSEAKTLSAPYDGFAALLFVVLTSLTIVLLEPLRADSEIIGAGYRAWQVGALLALVACLGVLAWQAPPRSETEPESAE